MWNSSNWTEIRMYSRLSSISLVTANGVTYATVFDEKYPKKLAKAFSLDLVKLLEQVIIQAHKKMLAEFGSSGIDIRSRLETIDQPYYFINFGK